MGRYLPTGIVKGLGVTGGTMLRTIRAKEVFKRD